MTRNEAFFSLYENVFLTYKKLHGEKEAIEFLKHLFSKSLGDAYDSEGFKKGDPEDFARIVQSRDNSVGLKVEFPEISSNRVVYQFHEDPFPRLKGEIDRTSLDRSYLDFKVGHVLGEGWNIETTKHLWKGDSVSEHIITKA